MNGMDNAKVSFLPKAPSNSGVDATDGRVARKKGVMELGVKPQTIGQFITENFSYKECCYFVPKKPTATITDTTQCQCGELKKFHGESTISIEVPADPSSSGGEKPKEVKWSRAEHIRRHQPTNAYGKIKFLTEISTIRDQTEYIRLCDEDDLDATLNLMIEHWGLMKPDPPSLCLSVIGGAKNFQLTGRKRDVFQKGFIKAAQTTGAWIITSGLNLGVTKVVGEALATSEGYHYEKKRLCHQLRCIGISPWGYVLDKEALLNSTIHHREEEQDAKTYRISNRVQSGEPVSLNAHHTHYLLVDDGIRRSYGGSKSATFRAQLERKVALPLESGGLGIPVVLIILEGGHDVFIDCSNSIEQRVPVVICNNTGRAADVLAYAANNMDSSMVADSGTNHALSRLLDEVYHSDAAPIAEDVKAKKKEEACKLIAKIIKDKSLITVYNLERNQGHDFDSVILCALLRRRDENTSCSKQMQLALMWNRVDIAEKILDMDKSVNMDDLGECMKRALLGDKVDFVKLFLDHGQSMREFLTVATLTELYSETARENRFDRLMWRYLKVDLNQKPLTLKSVEKLISRLMGRGHYKCRTEQNPDQMYSRKHSRHMSLKKCKHSIMDMYPPNAKFMHPFTELFLWSILHCRHEMAKLLWNQADESLPLALVATKLYASMRSTLPPYDTENLDEYDNNKAEFEQLATGVLQEAHEIDSIRTSHILERPVPVWDNMSCLELAVSAHNRTFLSCAAAQSSLEYRWSSGISAPFYMYFLCLLLPIFIPIKGVLNFKRHMDVEMDNSTENHGARPEEDNGTCDRLRWNDKILLFYKSPKVKYIIYASSYVVFLLVYSYFILFSVRVSPSEHLHVSVVEIVVLIYIAAIVVDHVREIVVSHTSSMWVQLKEWWIYHAWNKVDVLMVSLVLIAAFMRIWDDETLWWCRTLYSLAGLLIYLNLLRLCTASSSLGPKLVMIARMIQELMIFLVILGVAMCAYGVTSQALLYPDRPYTNSIFKDVIYLPYWQIHGEIFLDEISGKKEGCRGNLTDADGEYCPQKHFMVPLLLAVYLMLGNVLLLNLLIAIFAYIFDEIQTNSMKIWKFKMFIMVMEFERKPLLPMPFLIVEDCLLIGYYFYHRRQKKRLNYERMLRAANPTADLERDLLNFETSCKVAFLRDGEHSRRLTSENQLVDLRKKMETVTLAVEECQQMLRAMSAVVNRDMLEQVAFSPITSGTPASPS